MSEARAYAALAPSAPLGPVTIERREPGEHDVVLDIAYCGVCHSDLHHVRSEWGAGTWPMVPGHEIVGHVVAIGSGVRAFAVGDRAAVGCMVDACRSCAECQGGHEQFCDHGPVWTYNSQGRDGANTLGGYSTRIVVDEAFTLRVPGNLDLAAAAPLLCAGITTWSPLRRWQAGPGARVAVVGLGGLGHMAVKLAASLGAEVTVLSSSRAKEADAARLGAHDFAASTAPDGLARLGKRFDLVLDTLSAPHDYNALLGTVRTGGAMVLVGVPPDATPVHAFSLIMGRRTLSGSLIGGIRETQEMLDYCGRHNIVADIELIPMHGINDAYERMLRSDVRYRFVLDLATI